MDLQNLIVFVLLVGAAYVDGSNNETTMKLSSFDDRVTTLELKQNDIYDKLFAFREEMDRRRYLRNDAHANINQYPSHSQTESITTTTEPTTTTARQPSPLRMPHVSRDCGEDWVAQRYTNNGVYVIRPDPTTNEDISVFCDIKGWTVIQKRTDSSNINYAKSLEEYSRGFGQVDGDYWLGLNYVHAMTATGNWTLRFRLETFDRQVAWAYYSGFSIGPGPDFVLNFDPKGFRGKIAGDSLGLRHHGRNYSNLRGMKFTTLDSDQDNFADGNCAVIKGGSGWWYNNCNLATTTGMDEHRIYWHTWKRDERLKRVTMSIRKN